MTSWKRPIYLDYAATTPVLPEVISAMESALAFETHFGNPHSNTHDYGLAAANLVNHARARFAELIGAEALEIVYTSGATEANNLALQGAAYFYQRRGKHIISVQTEHKAVLDVLKFLEQQGFSITYLPVNAAGLIDLEDLKAAIRPDTILASIMLVNNEIGVIQPIQAAAKILQEKAVLLHVDAAQGLGKLMLNVRDLNADLISFSAHKIYGPKGIGALYIRNTPKIHLRALMYGGSQQQGLRPGTLAPSLIQGFTRALELVTENFSKENSRILALKHKLWQGLSALNQKIKLNSMFEWSVPQICNISFQGLEGELLMAEIKEVLAVAQGSACNSIHIEPSHVLRAIGLKQADAHSSIRISLGHYTSPEDIDVALKVFAKLYVNLP